MVVWWISAWVLAAALAAAVFHRLRTRSRPVAIPPEVLRFLRCFEAELGNRHPRVRLAGMVPGKFAAVLAIEGQETPVLMHGVFRHWRSYPETLPRLVDRLVQEVAEGALEQPSEHLFEDVATRILPQIRSKEWLASQGSSFGDAALVSRPYAADLGVCYVIDDSWSLVFLTRAHLRQWRKSQEDVHRLALGNLRREFGKELPLPGPDRPVVISHKDGFDASRVLLLDPEKVEGLLVALPERDLLWLGAEGTRGLDSLMRVNAGQSVAATHPISKHLYRVESGELRLVEAGGRAGRPST